ncbi:hypothetical protein [Vibrio sp. THAF190c]|uniref:hypothetical protein n=1 Tax=Vibrio sp. THAF190c TaxID=2587865 RepID=UPI0012693CA6|nr:hypothetical protein [Vibrio sp. THAF190c]QFT13541.1 hypothetical protein FIV04_26660 [Vibrio sp. THAF190c]
MKKLILIAALLTPLSANAKSPKEVGRLFADVVACTISGEYTKGQKAEIDIAIIQEYNIVQKGEWWKGQMEKGKHKEFARLEGLGEFEKKLMCAVIKGEWL